MAEYCRVVLGAKSVVVIGRGVDRSWFSSNADPKTIDAIFVGRVSKDKGVDTLLRAWREVLQTRQNARLTIVGSSDEQEFFEEMSADLNLGLNVTFVGYVSEKARIRQMLQSSKIFLLPTTNEGFARAVAEAMASGLPCILSDIPNLREVYGGAAVFVPVGDHLSLAEEIIDLLADESKRVRLGQSSRAFAKRFQWDKVARITAVAFASCLNQRINERQLDGSETEKDEMIVKMSGEPVTNSQT
jgi:glycosyltransferase involved in cell wall biosynthesis